jgi:Holliday junction resolvase RusA-like endonuclease
MPKITKPTTPDWIENPNQTKGVFVNVKPLSVNQAWQGRRFKTPKYKQYEALVLSMLPELTIKKDMKYQLDLTVGYSNKLSDIDNFLKPFLDILQKKYNFNDHQIYKMIITKSITTKNNEFIIFNFTPLL